MAYMKRPSPLRSADERVVDLIRAELEVQGIDERLEIAIRESDSELRRQERNKLIQSWASRNASPLLS